MVQVGKVLGGLVTACVVGSVLVSQPLGAAPDVSLQTWTCNGIPATIVGTPGGETLTGTPAADVIVAREGNDTIRGLGGDDIICAGKGNDIVYGGAGFDILYGAQGNDVLQRTVRQRSSVPITVVHGCLVVLTMTRFMDRTNGTGCKVAQGTISSSGTRAVTG